MKPFLKICTNLYIAQIRQPNSSADDSRVGVAPTPFESPLSQGSHGGIRGLTNCHPKVLCKSRL